MSDGNKNDGDIFTATSWTLVREALGDSLRSSEALQELCQKYWRPLYAYIRHRGYNREDAEDLTQAFFQFLLKNDRLRIVDREKGKLRAFLLVLLKGFLSNHRDYIRAQKRGGGRVVFSLDAEDVENGYLPEPDDGVSPDVLYERRWARDLMERAMKALEGERRTAVKEKVYQALKGFVMEDGDYARAGESLSMTSNSVAVAVHRLRNRFRRYLQDEVAQTVSGRGEIEEEMRHLYSVLSTR